MPPKRAGKKTGVCGQAFTASIADVRKQQVYLQEWGERPWKPRIRSYPLHRQHVLEAAAGLADVLHVVERVQLPEEILDLPIEWVETHILTQATPRHMWRENVGNLWWEVIVHLTDAWEAAAETDEETVLGKMIDDLTTAVDMIRSVKFPDTYDNLR